MNWVLSGGGKKKEESPGQCPKARTQTCLRKSRLVTL